jgi:hypothetical protein
MLRRAIPILPAIAVLATAAPAAAAPGRAVLAGCSKSVDVTQRSAVFQGSMRAVRGSVRMQMRFTLQSRTREDPVYRAVAAPGFGVWLTSDRGVGRYVYTKRVEQLLAPAAYRAVVRFRWLDARHHVIARARRTTRACREPDPRPNLVVGEVIVEPEMGGARYVALVQNTGRTDAPPFVLRFAAAGTPFATVPVGGLAAHDSTRVAVDRAVCAPGEAIAAEADPDAVVDERRETDNVLETICPAPS